VLSKHGRKALEDPVLSGILKMRAAYLGGEQGAFDGALQQIEAAQLRSSIHQLPKPQLELVYNRVNPFLWSKICYGLALLLALIGLMVSHRAVLLSSRTLVWLGLGMHSFGLVARMVIMGRPPLSTLYETFLFAGWTAVLLGIAMDFFQKRSPGALVSSVGGFIMIHMAGKFGGDGDTMGMLVAVLNNNFWLATHITTIMLGYAGVCSAGVIGHVYLLQRMIAPAAHNREKLAGLDRSLYGVLAFGFIFTVIGTLFGGLWAQQSWGRFWGWDPKENGALLIILWCSIVFHARAGGWMRQGGTAAGAIVGFVVVMMTWLGVNLLGVGLHSYGFTSAGALYLFSIMGGEALFLLIAGVLISRKAPAAVMTKEVKL
jgi:cytochrome c-type biogenesis protein CcsB